ncbi:MAG: hypothetical protein LBQ08_04285 [Holosporaceae bacterium]|jgi:hypothetical protein|nr:hypothetical protein [Holosporaceae bacterium]
MKKILGVLAIICLNYDSSARIDVVASSNNFLSSSIDPIVFKVTNNGGEKTQLKVTILRGSKTDISNDNADEDFCINKGQDIYIAPGNQEEVKLIHCPEEARTSIAYKVIFQDSKGNKTVVPLNAIAPPEQSLELKEIKKDHNGFLKAIISK